MQRVIFGVSRVCGGSVMIAGEDVWAKVTICGGLCHICRGIFYLGQLTFSMIVRSMASFVDQVSSRDSNIAGLGPGPVPR